MTAKSTIHGARQHNLKSLTLPISKNQLVVLTSLTGSDLSTPGVVFGPEGGAAGGKLIAQEIPERVARIPGSYIGMFLREILC